MTRRTLIGLSLVLAAAVGPVSREALGQAPPPDDAVVASAIEKGIAFLREQQARDGSWPFIAREHDLGMTTLAALAMLENGVPVDDPAIRKATSYVREAMARNSQTYDVALSILFLSRIQQGRENVHDETIRQLAARLDAAEVGGTWSYGVPDRPSPRPEETARSSSGRNAGRARSSIMAMGTGDNSNTQFALLGLWAAGRQGFASSPALAAIDEHFRSTLLPEGRWGYRAGDIGRNAMTCAGLMGLAIAAARPELAERQNARSRGAALAADPAFQKALRAVGDDARQIGPQSEVYYLWSLERVCVALGLRSLDGFDWYAAGANVLLGSQLDDGGWPNGPWGRLPDSALALLFLRKANLAFELDRVLKLPTAERPAAPVLLAQADIGAAKAPAVEGEGGADDGPEVVVTGASDANFPEIAVDFEVRGPDGSFVLDGARDDFKVYEEGREAQIARFLSPYGEPQPITVVLVVDRSGSMEEEDRIGGLKSAVGTFLDGLPKGSKVAVVAFGSEVERICPFTDDFEKARETVNRLRPAGATRYYDAVADALELIQEAKGRRAVLALTDGEDTFSQFANLENVTAMAVRLGLPIHTLGLGSEDEIESESLKRLAEATRGQYYPAREAEQLKTIYQRLAERLRSSYTLVYRSDRKVPDGTLRPVRVVYRASSKAGETAVFIPGMVVPAPGWSPLFLALVLGLAVLAGRSRPG